LAVRHGRPTHRSAIPGKSIRYTWLQHFFTVTTETLNMASINKVILIGNLGRDPEMRHTAQGNAVANIAIATSRNWKDKTSGEKMEETEWHRVVFFDRLAEVVGQYLKKGRPVYVEGRLKTRKWTDKDGVERYTTEIVGEVMQMLGARDDIDGGSNDGGNAQRSAPARQAAPARASAAEADPFDDDSIPF